MKKNDPRRGILIALVCVFTLLLVGELALVCLFRGESAPEAMTVPSNTVTREQARGGDFTPGDFTPSAGEGFTPPQGSDRTGGVPFPEGGDRMGDAAFPEHGDRAGDFAFPEQPEDIAAMPASAPSGILGTLRRAWLPIVTLCAAGIGVCLFLLVRLKKKKPEAPHKSDMPELETELENEVRPRKSSAASWVTAIALLLTLALILSSLPSGSTNGDTVVNTQVLSAQAETTAISTVLSGAGTLSGADGIGAEIPDSVSVESYHVKNGDLVAAGDILASVSQVQTASAIAELQSVLEELDKDLNEQRSKTADTAVNASASGRVKAIFVQEGDSVEDVMYDRGALMLLSLDGLMAVDIPAGDLKAGDSVTVTLSDGTDQPGRISQILDGTATVTTADDTAPCDDSVSVTDGEGNTLGTGKLYIHSQLKVTGFSGTVSRVQAALNRKVTAGTGLITLKDTGPTFEYYRLLARRQELEEIMLDLTKLSRDGFLRAEQAGQVSGIPEDGDFVPLASSGEEFTASNLTDSEPVRLVLLSDVQGGGQGEQKPDGSQDPPAGAVTYAASVSAVSGSVMILNITTDPVDLTAMDAQSALAQFPTQPIPYTYNETTPITDSDGNSLMVSDLAEGDVLVITVSMDAGGNISINAIQRVFSSQPEKPTDPSQGGNNQGGSGQLPGGITIPGDITVPNGVTIPDRNSLSGGFSGIMSGGNTGKSSQEAYDTYSTGTTRVLTITPQEEMTISIQVDELDILSLRTGLGAQITLDALEGQSFAGTVTSIAREGENEGGNTKFAVEVTLPKEDAMLPGMNASVKIVTAVSDPVQTLPASALVETGGRTCVYLGYDEKKDQLTDLTEVQTGLSDGDRVQILSGLPEGGTVYYRYADTVVYSFTNG